MNLVFISVIILFVAYAVNRYIMTNATRRLDDSFKLKLFEVFSNRNNYATFFVLGLVILYFGALQIYPQYNSALAIGYSIVFILYLFFRFASNYKKLKQLGAPPQYVKSFIFSYGIFVVAFLVVGLCLIWNLYW